MSYPDRILYDTGLYLVYVTVFFQSCGALVLIPYNYSCGEGTKDN